MKVAVAQLGARMHYAVPEALQAEGMLHRLYTDAYAGRFPFGVLRCVPARLRPASLRRLLGRRARLPARKVRAFQRFGLQYARRLRESRSPTEVTAAYLWAGDRFDELIVQDGLDGAGAVYGYQSAALGLFRHARVAGVRTILEQTILPRALEDELMAEERKRWVAWEPAVSDANAAAYAEREAAEWGLADCIVCGSGFVAEGLLRLGVPEQRVRVVPYGVSLAERRQPGRERQEHHPLRVLFVGALRLRKGVPYLLQAAGKLPEVRFRLVGPLTCGGDALRAMCPGNVEVFGPVPRREVARHYGWADVFCLPSICEGSATVVYEALAAALPVVTTPNAGSIVRDGTEGFIVPVRDPEAIARALDRLAGDGALLRAMSEAAAERSRFGSTQAYGRRLVEAISAVGAGG